MKSVQNTQRKYGEQKMKTKKTNKAQVGDVIQSNEFETVDVRQEPNLFSNGHYIVGSSVGYGVKKTEISGKDRADYHYVVEETAFDGGGSSSRPGEDYADGWHVTARRLGPEGRYDPKGELIEFYQSGCFTSVVNEVNVVGKLEKVVNFV